MGSWQSKNFVIQQLVDGTGRAQEGLADDFCIIHTVVQPTYLIWFPFIMEKIPMNLKKHVLKSSSFTAHLINF